MWLFYNPQLTHCLILPFKNQTSEEVPACVQDDSKARLDLCISDSSEEIKPFNARQ
jgi:hypothetical protein